MPDNRINILSTRPLNRKLIKEAATLGIIIEEISFIETKSIEDKKVSDVIEHYAQKMITAVFTSMNAVDAVVKHLKKPPQWKIYCIGNTTKNLVGKYFGKEAIVGTAANADELGDVIVGEKITSIVFFCGDQRRNELPAKLKQHQVTINEVVVYNTIETPVLINKQYQGILFFSPSAVQSFFSVNKIDQNTQLFAIGSTTAGAIKQNHKNNVLIPGSPGKENMVKEVVRYYRGKV